MADPSIIDLTELTDSEDSQSESDGDGDPQDERSTSSSSPTSSRSASSQPHTQIDIPVNDATRMQLYRAIATVPENRLRMTVALLVDHVPQFERLLVQELVAYSATRQQGKRHKLQPRWQVCVQCKEEFDCSTTREDDECVFHSGDLEVDYESFVDWDEDCHGPMDSTRNRRDYPENFTWSCCDRDGRSRGCMKNEHSAAKQTRKRRRL